MRQILPTVPLLCHYCGIAFKLKALYPSFRPYIEVNEGTKMKAEVKLQLRLPMEIRNALAVDAANNHRSMNGQVIAILAERFRAIGLPTEPKIRVKNSPRG
jgi:hypothetical protein